MIKKYKNLSVALGLFCQLSSVANAQQLETIPSIETEIEGIEISEESKMGAGSSGGGGMIQAIRFEQEQLGEAWYHAFNATEFQAKSQHGKWLDQTLNFMQQKDQYYKKQDFFYIGFHGVKIVSFLALGGYGNIDTNQAAHFSFLKARMSLDDPYFFAGYVPGKYQLDQGHDLQINGEPVAAINKPQADQIIYDLSTIAKYSDCQVFKKQFAKVPKGVEKCHALSANLIVTHEFLSLTGLEADGNYTHSIGLRGLLHFDDRLQPGFAEALVAGIRKFYGIDEDYTQVKLYQYDGYNPGRMNDLLYKWKHPGRSFPRWSRINKEYIKATNPIVYARREIRYILSRNLNKDVEERLKELNKTLNQYIIELNAHYSGTVSGQDLVSPKI